MAQLGLQLVQKAPREPVMEIHEEQTEAENAGGENIWISCRTPLLSGFLKFLHASVKSDIIRPKQKFLNSRTNATKGYACTNNVARKSRSGNRQLQQQGHIEKLVDCSDRYFFSTIVITVKTDGLVITVKNDGSVKLVLEALDLNQKVHKNKYQMPNIEDLDKVGQTISEKNVGDIYFSTMDLTYAFG